MVKTEYQHVIKEKGYRSGMARIEGAGVTVAGIIIMRNAGDDLDAIVAAYPGLTKEKAQEALAYYGDHETEIDRDIYTLTNPPKGYSVGKYGILQKK